MSPATEDRPVLPHRQLFAKYVEALRTAIDEARAERAGAINAVMRAGLPRAEAEAKIANENGPLCVHPRIIAVFREYFLGCDRLNRERPPEEFVDPGVFTTERLMGKHDDLADVLSEFPYMPIGTDENDRYV
jgi:hypothetical protein